MKIKKKRDIRKKQSTVWVLTGILALTGIAWRPLSISAKTLIQNSKTASVTQDTPKPLIRMDFEQGLQEYMNEDDDFQILKSNNVYIQKRPDQLESSETVDANGIIYTGSGERARYNKGTISNQPVTAYDEKGTVLQLDASVTIGKICKTKSAGIESDVEATNTLDQLIAVSEAALVQEAYTASSGLKISNPFSGMGEQFKENKKGITIRYWICVPKDEEGNHENSSVLRWESMNRNLYEAEDYAKYLVCKEYDQALAQGDEQQHCPSYYQDYHTLPIEVDVNNMTPEEISQQGIIQQEFSNGIHYMKLNGSKVRFAETDGELQIDANSSIYWTQDTGRGVNSNPNSPNTYGTKITLEEKNTFYMNSWRGSNAEPTSYIDADYVADSPVSKSNEKNANAGTWHQVTVTLKNDWVQFYLDGEMIDISQEYSSLGTNSLDNDGFLYDSTKDNSTSTSLLDWICREDTNLYIGSIGMSAGDYNMATQNSKIRLDDLEFYDCLLTTEQITSLYNDELAVMNQKDADVLKQPVEEVVLNKYEELVESAAEIISDTISGTPVSVLKVNENRKTLRDSGIRIQNPFAGKELNGATIAYWVKQEGASDIISTNALQATSNLTFMDEEKFVFQPKDIAKSDNASSILYLKSNGEAIFQEAYMNKSLGGSLKNLYCFIVSSEESQEMLNASDEWHYMVMTINNGGVQLYRNGNKISNVAETTGTVRFLDGHYQKLKDKKDPKTNYGVFGSAGNQGATTLMTFLTYADTYLYLGYLPQSGGISNDKTCNTFYYGMKAYNYCLSDNQVSILYQNATPTAEPVEPSTDVSELPPTPSATTQPTSSALPYKMGDINQDNSVDLDDVTRALKAALTIVKATNQEILLGDFDNTGDISLDDVTRILRIALTID